MNLKTFLGDMKTYLQMDGDQLVELVEKREYDELLNLLESEKSTRNAIIQKGMETEHALAYLSTRLATITFDPVQPLHFAENVANHIDYLRDEINAQNASSESEMIAEIQTQNLQLVEQNLRLIKSKDGILQDAVNRMEFVDRLTSVTLFTNMGQTIGEAMDDFRSRLIQAAKGDLK